MKSVSVRAAFLILLFLGVGELEGLNLNLSPLDTSQVTELITYTGEATGWNNGRKIVVDHDGDIHIVYQYSLAPGQPQDLVIYARSEDGQAWTIERLAGRFPAITTDGNRIYIALVQRSASSDVLWLYRKDSSGWHSQVIWQAAPRSIFYPAIAVEGGSPPIIHLVWELHSSSLSWIKYAQVSGFGEEQPQVQVEVEDIRKDKRGLYFPSLALDGAGRAHVLWEEEVTSTKHRISHGVRLDTGEWHIRENISGEADARYPSIDFYHERIHAIFVLYESDRSLIYHDYYTQEGWGQDHGGLLLVSQGLEDGLWTFPVIENGHALFSKTVAAGCGVGPFYWNRLSNSDSASASASSWATPQPVAGEFASFPQLIEGLPGVLHIIWTDRHPEDPIKRLVRYMQM